jgi:hypothetical protein
LGQSAVTEIRSQGFIVDDASDGFSDSLHVLGIYEQLSGADDLRTRRSVELTTGHPYAIAPSSDSPKPSKGDG